MATRVKNMLLAGPDPALPSSALVCMPVGSKPLMRPLNFIHQEHLCSHTASLKGLGKNLQTEGGGKKEKQGNLFSPIGRFQASTKMLRFP